MSVADLNKVIIIQNATNGKIVQTINFEDYKEYKEAEFYLDLQVHKLLESEEGVYIKIGNKP